MADRILVWYVENIVGDGVESGPTFYVEKDYTPSALRVMLKRTADAADFQFDILDDGVSIMNSLRGRVRKGDASDPDADNFPFGGGRIVEGSLVSLNLTPSGAKGITVQLELEE